MGTLLQLAGASGRISLNCMVPPSRSNDGSCSELETVTYPLHSFDHNALEEWTTDPACAASLNEAIAARPAKTEALAYMATGELVRSRTHAATCPRDVLLVFAVCRGPAFEMLNAPLSRLRC